MKNITKMKIEIVAPLIIFPLSYMLRDTILSNLDLSNISSFYQIVATIFGGLLGFVIASLSILIGLLYGVHQNNIYVERLRNRKWYPLIYKIFFQTIVIMGITVVISMVGMLFKFGSSLFFFTLVIYFSIIGALRLYRCVWVLHGIIKIVEQREDI